MSDNRVVPRIRIGTAGWAIPSQVRDAFSGEGSGLARYASRFSAVEINSSFHRRHRPSTYARWAATVPPDFRFAVKVPKLITHGQRLIGCGDLLSAFLTDISELGDRLGPLLVQLPPSLAFDMETATAFFGDLRERFSGHVVCEPRHVSWFAADADHFLSVHQVVRVTADPAPVEDVVGSGRDLTQAYYRLHGSPTIYRSAYGEHYLHHLALRIVEIGKGQEEIWVIFDNTASGAAATDALLLDDTLNSVN